VGCVARILEAVELPDGRWAMLAQGTRRIRVRHWLEDDPYPLAEVEDWPDDAPSPADAARARELTSELRSVLALATEVGDQVASAATVELDPDPVTASYRLAALAPVGSFDRLVLLAAPTVGERLSLVAQMLADLRLVLASRLEGG